MPWGGLGSATSVSALSWGPTASVATCLPNHRRPTGGRGGMAAFFFLTCRFRAWAAGAGGADVFFSLAGPLQRLAGGAALAGHIFGEPLLGRIEPGAPADLTVLQYAPPTPLQDGNVAGHWLFGLSAPLFGGAAGGGGGGGAGGAGGRRAGWCARRRPRWRPARRCARGSRSGQG